MANAITKLSGAGFIFAAFGAFLAGDYFTCGFCALSAFALI